MRIIPQHVSGHVRDTCMTFLGINKCKNYMLVTCRKYFRINNVSFCPQGYLCKNYKRITLQSEFLGLFLAKKGHASGSNIAKKIF